MTACLQGSAFCWNETAWHIWIQSTCRSCSAFPALVTHNLSALTQERYSFPAVECSLELESIKGLGEDLSFPPLEGEEIWAFIPPWHSETALLQGRNPTHHFPDGEEISDAASVYFASPAVDQCTALCAGLQHPHKPCRLPKPSALAPRVHHRRQYYLRD